jgi:hypothetical protein
MAFPIERRSRTNGMSRSFSQLSSWYMDFICREAVMTSDLVPVRAEYREKLRVKHLAMEPALQGASASLTFESHDIRIALPCLQAGNAEPDRERIEVEADAWNSGGEILQLYIYAIAVIISSLTFEIPAAAARHPSIDVGLFSDEQHRRSGGASRPPAFLRAPSGRLLAPSSPLENWLSCSRF